MYQDPTQDFWAIFGPFVCVTGIICAFLASCIGRHKGYSGGWAALTGLLFGILGLIYYAGLPDKTIQNRLARPAQQPLEEQDSQQPAPPTKPFLPKSAEEWPFVVVFALAVIFITGYLIYFMTVLQK